METALAAATHERDLRAEEARLASEGVVVLEQRLERLRHDGERALSEAERQRERESVEAERRREHEVAETEDKAQRAIAEVEREREEKVASIERELAGAKAQLEAREQELERVVAAEGELRAELKGVRDELGEVGERLGERERAVVGLERDLAEAERRREREIAGLQRDLAERSRALEGAQERVEAGARQAAEASERLEARERELAAAAALVEAQGGELAAARKDLREKGDEARAAGERLEAAASDLERARNDLGRMRDEFERASADLAESRAALGRLKTERDQARADAHDVRGQLDEARRQLGETRERLEAREGHLKNAQAGVKSRDRRLAAAERALADRDRRLALSEARLEKSQARAEHFKTSLVALRSGRAYRLMRVLWRLRHPFRRAPRTAPEGEPSAEEERDGPPAADGPAATTPPPPRRRRTGERLRVAAILDEMSAACFAPECDLIPLPLEGWREQLDGESPDLLLVESAWNGNDGQWQYRIAEYPRKDLAGLPALRELVAACRERGIPTAFWNKEDPVHFERFAEAASLFDHVFTTDAGCVERYRELPGERTVTPLPFAAQPRIHNPAAVVPERSASPCFAGAWYRDRHPERKRALEALLDAARPRGLVIYDRRFGDGIEAFSFPERFAPHILGKLPYEQVLDVYKSHRIFLNANSVVDSPTMCSRRVFELAASDTAILSTPGAALSTLLGEGLVAEAGDKGTAAAELERLLGDEGERRRRTRAARRRVFAEHTYADRLATIATTAGLPLPDGEEGSWELVIQPGVELDDDALADLRAASVYAGADVIGVAEGNGAAPVEHRRVESLDPRALLVRRDLIERRGPLADSPDRVAPQLRRWRDEGTHLYAADADLLSTSLR